jgi:hypothetical protein
VFCRLFASDRIMVVVPLVTPLVMLLVMLLVMPFVVVVMLMFVPWGSARRMVSPWAGIDNGELDLAMDQGLGKHRCVSAGKRGRLSLTWLLAFENYT